MKKYYKILLFVILGLLFVCFVSCIVSSAIWMKNLELLEMNAQIEKFGFYKKDVILLKNLYWDNVRCDILMGIGMSGFIGLCAYIVFCFVDSKSWIYQ